MLVVVLILIATVVPASITIPMLWQRIPDKHHSLCKGEEGGRAGWGGEGR